MLLLHAEQDRAHAGRIAGLLEPSWLRITLVGEAEAHALLAEHDLSRALLARVPLVVVWSRELLRPGPLRTLIELRLELDRGGRGPAGLLTAILHEPLDGVEPAELPPLLPTLRRRGPADLSGVEDAKRCRSLLEAHLPETPSTPLEVKLPGFGVVYFSDAALTDLWPLALSARSCAAQIRAALERDPLVWWQGLASWPVPLETTTAVLTHRLRTAPPGQACIEVERVLAGGGHRPLEAWAELARLDRMARALPHLHQGPAALRGRGAVAHAAAVLEALQRAAHALASIGGPGATGLPTPPRLVDARELVARGASEGPSHVIELTGTLLTVTRHLLLEALPADEPLVSSHEGPEPGPPERVLIWDMALGAIEAFTRVGLRTSRSSPRSRAFFSSTSERVILRQAASQDFDLLLLGIRHFLPHELVLTRLLRRIGPDVPLLLLGAVESECPSVVGWEGVLLADKLAPPRKIAWMLRAAGVTVDAPAPARPQVR